MFKFVENVLPSQVLEKIITKYCSDHRHYEPHWYITNFTKTPLDRDDLMLVCDALVNSNLPFAKDLKVSTAKFNCVNKILPGGSLPPHYDTVRHSITIFLNDVEPDAGGEFFWHDDNDVVHTITPEKNCAVYEFLDESTTNHVHGVTPLHAGARYSLQLFFGTQHTDKINIGVTPDWVDISKYKYIDEPKV